MGGDGRTVAFQKFYVQDLLGMVITTVAFVAGVVLPTDGHLAASLSSRRHYKRGELARRPCRSCAHTHLSRVNKHSCLPHVNKDTHFPRVNRRAL